VRVYVSLRSPVDRPAAAAPGRRASMGWARGTHRTRAMGAQGDGTVLQFRDPPWQWTAATEVQRDALMREI
jgi:hypothetical protein